jgi:hypothetical protein
MDRVILRRDDHWTQDPVLISAVVSIYGLVLGALRWTLTQRPEKHSHWIYFLYLLRFWDHVQSKLWTGFDLNLTVKFLSFSQIIFPHVGAPPSFTDSDEYWRHVAPKCFIISTQLGSPTLFSLLQWTPISLSIRRSCEAMVYLPTLCNCCNHIQDQAFHFHELYSEASNSGQNFSLCMENRVLKKRSSTCSYPLLDSLR